MNKFDKYNKRIKFIYAGGYTNAFRCNAYYDVTYGNKAPNAFCKRWNVATLLRGFHVYHTGRTYDFIPNNEPNEAEVIRGLYLYLRYEYNHARNILRQYNKRDNVFKPDQDIIRNIVKEARVSMMIYKKKYLELRDAGVYTYLELMR